MGERRRLHAEFGDEAAAAQAVRELRHGVVPIDAVDVAGPRTVDVSVGSEESLVAAQGVLQRHGAVAVGG